MCAARRGAMLRAQSGEGRRFAMASEADPAGETEPMAAAYPITPEELRRAIEREGAPYINNFVGLFESLNAQIAKHEADRTPGHAPAQTASTEEIADLRRRAEAIGAEYDRRREADDQRRRAAILATRVGEDAPGGLRARLARWWRGDE